jgi:hypothetical protein
VGNDVSFILSGLSDLATAAFSQSPTVSLSIPDTPVAASDQWALNRSRWTHIFPLRTSSSAIRRENQLIKAAIDQRPVIPRAEVYRGERV